MVKLKGIKKLSIFMKVYAPSKSLLSLLLICLPSTTITAYRHTGFFKNWPITVLEKDLLGCNEALLRTRRLSLRIIRTAKSPSLRRGLVLSCYEGCSCHSRQMSESKQTNHRHRNRTFCVLETVQLLDNRDRVYLIIDPHGLKGFTGTFCNCFSMISKALYRDLKFNKNAFWI